MELAPDRMSCKDVDECSITSGICSNGACENLMGTYQCVCDDGKLTFWRVNDSNEYNYKVAGQAKRKLCKATLPPPHISNPQSRSSTIAYLSNIPPSSAFV